MFFLAAYTLADYTGCMYNCCLQGEEAVGGLGRLRPRLDRCAEPEEEAQAAGG